MSRLLELLTIVAAVSLVATGCSSGAFGPSIETPATPSPRPIDKLTLEERRALLERAEVWQPTRVASLDLLAGPDAKDGFRFNESVECEFDFPDKPFSGVTPKFDCRFSPDDKVKVKYGRDNGEVYAEVAATRLFWAMGFFVDRMYPVRVTCHQCPENPHRESTTNWQLGRPSRVATRVFAPATIERPFKGEDIEVPGYEGWGWRELEHVGGEDGGATRAQIDALKLLAVFVQHVDSKPEQQALVCADDDVTEDRRGNESCRRPKLVVKDLGSTFGAAHKLRYDKMQLASWRSVDIWKDKDSCQGHLTRSFVGSLEHPRISEAGRKFLADRLSQLSDAQLRDLFTAARVEERPDRVDGRQATVADWVAAFKDKRAQITEHRCRA